MTKTYVRYSYAKEDRQIMETMAGTIMALAEGRTAPDNVVPLLQAVGA